MSVPDDLLGWLLRMDERISRLERQCPNDERLDRLLQGTARLEEKMARLIDDVRALHAEYNTATNDIAARLDRLEGMIKENLTAEEAAEAKALLRSNLDRLRELGKDPANPIPPEPTT